VSLFCGPFPYLRAPTMVGSSNQSQQEQEPRLPRNLAG